MLIQLKSLHLAGWLQVFTSQFESPRQQPWFKWIVVSVTSDYKACDPFHSRSSWLTHHYLWTCVIMEHLLTVLTLEAMITSASCLFFFFFTRRLVLLREIEWEGGMKKQMVLSISFKAVIVDKDCFDCISNRGTGGFLRPTHILQQPVTTPELLKKKKNKKGLKTRNTIRSGMK